jgi:hypothetical protein
MLGEIRIKFVSELSDLHAFPNFPKFPNTPPTQEVAVQVRHRKLKKTKTALCVDVKQEKAVLPSTGFSRRNVI